MLAQTKSEKSEIAEKVTVAEVCYNSMPKMDSKQILDEINNEYLKIKYKLTMLEIIDLLLSKCDSYTSFVEKRKSMLELMKYRLVCMDSLGIETSIDPFSRTKVKEQLDLVKGFSDNSSLIEKIMKEIGRLNSSIETMSNQNNDYLLTINNKKNIVVDKTSFSDIDITPTVSFEELLIKRKVEDNQVVKVRSASSRLNMNIISQKTMSVIRRVYEMINKNKFVRDEIETSSNVNTSSDTKEIVPELVIVPIQRDLVDETIDNSLIEGVNDKSDIDNDYSYLFGSTSLDEPEKIVSDKTDDSIELVSEDFTNTDESTKQVDANEGIISLFETVTPFEEPALFVDKLEDVKEVPEINVSEPLMIENVELVDEIKLPEETEGIDEMPDVFWLTQDEMPDPNIDSVTSAGPSFDEQIDALLLLESNDNSKTRKKVA